MASTGAELRLSRLSPRAALLLGHGLARWGSRTWEFLAVLLLLRVGGSSLRLVALHGMLQAGAVALLGPPAGALVDHSPRGALVLGALAAQNAALVAAALLSSLLTISSRGTSPRTALGPSAPALAPWAPGPVHGPSSLVLSPLLGAMERAMSLAALIGGVAVLLTLSALSSAASMCRSLAVERDWAVVLAGALAPAEDPGPGGEFKGRLGDRDLEGGKGPLAGAGAVAPREANAEAEAEAEAEAAARAGAKAVPEGGALAGETSRPEAGVAEGNGARAADAGEGGALEASPSEAETQQLIPQHSLGQAVMDGQAGTRREGTAPLPDGGRGYPQRTEEQRDSSTVASPWLEDQGGDPSPLTRVTRSTAGGEDGEVAGSTEGEGKDSRGGEKAGSAAEEAALLLAHLNASLTRIDLVCRLGAPALVGVLAGLVPLPALCVAVAAWSLLSWRLEHLLALTVLRKCPALRGPPCAQGTPLPRCQCKPAPPKHSPSGALHGLAEQGSAANSGSSASFTLGAPHGPAEQGNSAEIGPYAAGAPEEGEGLLHGSEPSSKGATLQGSLGSPVAYPGASSAAGAETPRMGSPSPGAPEPLAAAAVGGKIKSSWKELKSSLLAGWSWVKGACTELVQRVSVYGRQTCVLPGLALALLYFTVLSFGDLMTAYLTVAGVPLPLLGCLSALAAVAGVTGTFLFPLALRRWGLPRATLCASLAQWTCLLPSAAAALVLRSVGLVPPAVLISSVVLSRVGLWMFDLGVVQIMQQAVPEHERGQVGGVQGALQQGLQVLSYVLCAVHEDPKDFWAPILASFAATSAACLLFLAFCLRRGGMGN